MADKDLMIHRDNLDMTEEGLAAVVSKLQKLGYNDYHGGALFKLAESLGFPYLCVEVVVTDEDEDDVVTIGDVCWATYVGRGDVEVFTLDELYAQAASYAAKAKR